MIRLITHYFHLYLYFGHLASQMQVGTFVLELQFCCSGLQVLFYGCLFISNHY